MAYHAPEIQHLATSPVPSAILCSSPPIVSLCKAHTQVITAFASGPSLLTLHLAQATNIAFAFLLVIHPTLEPSAILREMFLYGLWVAVWPRLGHHPAHLIIQDFVPSGVKVETCERAEGRQRGCS